jgi:hypothetical protein
MHMDQLVRAGRSMQAIDVLRHREDATMLPLQPRERRGRGVRPCLAMQPAAEIVEIMYARRIAREAFRRGDLLQRELRPQPACVAERAQPALGRQPGSGQDHKLRKAISPCRSGRDAGGNGRPARWPPSPRRSARRGCRRKDRGGLWSRPRCRGLMYRPSGAASGSRRWA